MNAKNARLLAFRSKKPARRSEIETGRKGKTALEDRQCFFETALQARVTDSRRGGLQLHEQFSLAPKHADDAALKQLASALKLKSVNDVVIGE